MEQILAEVKRLGEVEYEKPDNIKLRVPADRLVEAAKRLKELGFEHVVAVSGVDYPDSGEIEVVYHVSSYTVPELKSYAVGLATRVSRDSPKLPSLIQVWPSTEYQERETYEMLGVTFEGHPKLERLFLPEDWGDIPPLRKEFVLPRRRRK